MTQPNAPVTAEIRREYNINLLSNLVIAHVESLDKCHELWALIKELRLNYVAEQERKARHSEIDLLVSEMVTVCDKATDHKEMMRGLIAYCRKRNEGLYNQRIVELESAGTAAMTAQKIEMPVCPFCGAADKVTGFLDRETLTYACSRCSKSFIPISARTERRSEKA